MVNLTMKIKINSNTRLYLTSKLSAPLYGAYAVNKTSTLAEAESESV
jgi:hypothetical protein